MDAKSLKDLNIVVSRNFCELDEMFEEIRTWCGKHFDDPYVYDQVVAAEYFLNRFGCIIGCPLRDEQGVFLRELDREARIEAARRVPYHFRKWGLTVGRATSHSILRKVFDDEPQPYEAFCNEMMLGDDE